LVLWPEPNQSLNMLFGKDFDYGLRLWKLFDF